MKQETLNRIDSFIKETLYPDRLMPIEFSPLVQFRVIDISTLVSSTKTLSKEVYTDELKLREELIEMTEKVIEKGGNEDSLGFLGDVEGRLIPPSTDNDEELDRLAIEYSRSNYFLDEDIINAFKAGFQKAKER